MINVVLPDGRVKQTESAASRWMSIALKWDEKTPEQQIATVVKFLIGILAVAICLGVVFREAIFQKDSIFNYIVDGGWEKGVNIFAITASIMIIAVVMTGTEIVKRILKLLASVFGARGETVCRLISSFIKYVAIVAMLYYCFALFGVDTATLLASAGILSIAISLGAKDMVGDILAGLFIIFEGEFRVGDIVMIGDWRGTVLEIGVRTTKIEDGSKNIKIIRNSNVTGRYQYDEAFFLCVLRRLSEAGASPDHELYSKERSEYPFRRRRRHTGDRYAEPWRQDQSKRR